jgi:predicted dinucleotide-binding enzyme
VLGKGMVGGALGRRWAAGGHEVTFGVRDPSAPAATALASQTGAGVVGLADSVAGAAVVVLAVPWSAVPEVLDFVGDLEGAVLIDTTNASGVGYRPAMVTDRSGAETIASLVPGARVVKAFNGMSYRTMQDPSAFPLPPALLLAGDDQDAKDTVSELAAELGLEPIDAGPLAAALLLEYAGLLWVRLAFDRGMGRDFAIAIARRDAAS